jgi:hypothetical protein
MWFDKPACGNFLYLEDVVLFFLGEAEDVEGLVGEEHVLLVVDRIDAYLSTAIMEMN